MPFVFCETALNIKSKVPLFHLIKFFAHLSPNTWDSVFLWSRGPFIILPLPPVAGLSLTLTSNILWNIGLDVLFSNSQWVLNGYKSVHSVISHYTSNARYALSSKRYGTPADYNSCLRVICIILPAVGMAGYCNQETKCFL